MTSLDSLDSVAVQIDNLTIDSQTSNLDTERERLQSATAVRYVELTPHELKYLSNGRAAIHAALHEQRLGRN